MVDGIAECEELVGACVHNNGFRSAEVRGAISEWAAGVFNCLCIPLI